MRLVEEIKAQRGWNDDRVGVELGYGSSYLSKIRNGKKPVTDDFLAQVQALYDTPEGIERTADPLMGAMTKHIQFLVSAELNTFFRNLEADVFSEDLIGAVADDSHGLSPQQLATVVRLFREYSQREFSARHQGKLGDGTNRDAS